MSKTKKCNVLFANHVSTKQVGGAELVLDNIVSNLDQEKFNAVLLLQKDDGVLSDWNCFNKVDVEYYNFGSLKYSNKIVALFSMLIKILAGFFVFFYIFVKRDIKIVVANSLIAATFMVLPSKFFRKKFIYYEHNIAEQRKGHLIGLALKPVAYLSDAIICISEAVRFGLETEGVNKEKLHLVHNGYDFSRLDNNKNNERGLPVRHCQDVFRIGMVANFMPWKRHKLFLQILDELSKQVPKIRIEGILVGGCLPGNEEYYSEIVKWIEGYIGNASFKMTGFKNNIADYFRSFDALINPAHAEPFGLIFIESMYLKCVAVGSSNGAAPEIIQNGETGIIVNYDNIDDVVMQLKVIATDVTKRKEIGAKASLYVRDEFSINKQVHKIEELLLDLCNR